LAHFKNAAATALELGYRDSRITFVHYRELVKPKEAGRYWNIRPAISVVIILRKALAKYLLRTIICLQART